MAAYTDLFAIRDAALEPTGTISLANKLARLRVVSNLVMYFRTRQTTGFGAGSDGNGFHRRYRHHCLSQKSIELQIPRRVRAQTRHNSTRRDFKDSSERIALLSRFIDQLDHLLLCFVV